MFLALWVLKKRHVPRPSNQIYFVICWYIFLTNYAVQDEAMQGWHCETCRAQAPCCLHQTVFISYDPNISITFNVIFKFYLIVLYILLIIIFNEIDVASCWREWSSMIFNWQAWQGWNLNWQFYISKWNREKQAKKVGRGQPQKPNNFNGNMVDSFHFSAIFDNFWFLVFFYTKPNISVLWSRMPQDCVWGEGSEVPLVLSSQCSCPVPGGRLRMG